MIEQQEITLASLYASDVPADPQALPILIANTIYRSCHFIGPGCLLFLDALPIGRTRENQCDWVSLKDGASVCSAIVVSGSQMIDCVFSRVLFMTLAGKENAELLERYITEIQPAPSWPIPRALAS